MLRYGKRSKAWDEFMLDGHLAICRHCNALIRHSGSTSNLLNHLKKHDIKPEKSEMELLNTEMLEDEPEEEMQAIQVYEEVLENNEIIEETTEPYEVVGEFLDIHDKVETVNVDTACRICLSDIQKTIHVRFDDRIKSLGNLTYKDLFTEFIELELNALEPQHFCAVCAKKLVLMHEFKSKCYETQKILDEFIHNDQKHQIENMIVEETFEPIVPKTEDVDNENDNIEYLIEEVPANDIKYEELENVIENISQKYFAKDQTMADIVTRYECESCPSFYRSKNTLRIHYRRCHPLERTEDCQFCETKQFPIFLEDHMKNCRKNPNGKKNKTCPICGLLSNRNHIYRHVEANKLQNMGGNEKPYQCDICGVRTIAKAGMASHMQVQHLNYRLNCEVCGMDFKTPSVLSSHVRKYHPEKKSPLKCKICDYTTPDASSLRRHYLYHTGKKRHKCETCGREFMAKDVLRDHMTTHSDERPFPCPTCNSAFKTKKALGVHLKTHREREYECPVCSKNFLTNQQMRIHVKRYHPDYELPPPGTIFNKNWRIRKMKDEMKEIAIKEGVDTSIVESIVIEKPPPIEAKMYFRTNYANVERVDEI